MADPRLTLDWEGLFGKYATYKVDASTITYDATKTNGSAQVGLAVTVSANAGVIKLTEDGEAVEGKLVLVEADGYANVQVGGRMTLPAGASASTTRGKKVVGALGASSAKGYIREVATATAAELGVCRGRIIDAATSTAIWVDFD